MGSSAGGHLAALTSTYFEKINDYEINDEISRKSKAADDGYGITSLAFLEYVSLLNGINIEYNRMF